jgi:SulP family sulfate permease
LHLFEPDHPELRGLRPWTALRPCRGNRLGVRAHRQSGLPRLCTQVRAWRIAALSGVQPHPGWFIDSARRISLLEYASLLAIALLIIQIGFIAGVLIGVIIGCATFAVSASRVNAIKFSFDGSEYRSSLDRGPEELRILADHGREIQGMSLQSYLFFGSANRLYQQVKELFAQWPDTRFLLFDLRLVTGIDSSAMHSFTQIKRAADDIGARLVLVNLSPELSTAFRNR